ncbi:MAG TPA: HAD-IA family hydrolase [Chloroflexia bacterium]|jgi:putative hydrolase of the HAD superfamily
MRHCPREAPTLYADKPSPAKSRKRAVFLDAGLTLIYSEMSLAQRCVTAARQYGRDLTREEVEAVLPGAGALLHQTHKDDPDLWSSDDKLANLWLEYYKYIFTEVGISDPQEYAEAVYAQYSMPDAWQLYPDVIPTLRTLHEQGYIIGVISDWGSNLPGAILLPLGVGPYVSFMVVSTIQREAKPGSGLYREALARANVAPHEAVHVGDNYITDILGARAAGIEGVLLDRTDRHEAKLDCPRITTLAELPNLLITL